MARKTKQDFKGHTEKDENNLIRYIKRRNERLTFNVAKYLKILSGVE